MYTLTVVLFSLLAASGVGSMLYGKLQTTVRPPVLLLGAGMAVLLFAWLVPGFLRHEIGRPLVERILISVGLVTPLGLVLGMPFPAGLKAIGRFGRSLVPWAWAVNGAASVAAPVVAMIVAISTGFSSAFHLSAAAYVLGGALILGFGVGSPTSSGEDERNEPDAPSEREKLTSIPSPSEVCEVQAAEAPECREEFKSANAVAPKPVHGPSRMDSLLSQTLAVARGKGLRFVLGKGLQYALNLLAWQYRKRIAPAHSFTVGGQTFHCFCGSTT